LVPPIEERGHRSRYFHQRSPTCSEADISYPTVLYAKGLDGRIDDPNAGGKAVGFGRQGVAAYRGIRKAARA
jgi:hypothetical protein